jgi:hypothetical protein
MLNVAEMKWIIWIKKSKSGKEGNLKVENYMLIDTE